MTVDRYSEVFIVARLKRLYSELMEAKTVQEQNHIRLDIVSLVGDLMVQEDDKLVSVGVN